MAEKYVQTLDRSLDVLEVLAQAGEALGVTEIGNRISLHKSTVYRILGVFQMDLTLLGQCMLYNP